MQFTLSVDADATRVPAQGKQRVDAVVRVDARPLPGEPPPDPAGIGILIAVDFAPGRRDITRETATAAVSAVPDGASFALLGGGERPVTGYPFSGGWAVADRSTRGLAAFEAGRLMPLNAPAGATSYATWLALARRMFARLGPAVPVRHLLMITDGVGSGADRVDRELAACHGRFGCDVLGVGDRWDPRALLRIAARLHGRAAALPLDHDGPAAAATRALAPVLARLTAARSPALELGLTLRRGVRFESLAEVSPARRTLHPRRTAPRQLRFHTQMWAAETRSYLLSLTADPEGDPLETPLQLAAVTATAPAAPEAAPAPGTTPGTAPAAVTARWSWSAPPATGAAEAGRSVVFHLSYNGMLDAYGEGCIALVADRRDLATRRFAVATRLAHQLGDLETLAKLREIVEIEDAPRGLVRIRASVNHAVVHAGRLSSGTGPAPLPGPEPPPGGSAARCPDCGADLAAKARFCVRCGRRR
ncbi:hypothetical protein [Streptomyces sp. NPDC050504]|uniref:hypothetical protein n=1 Tax=Streptomyces sp. NPDC050504 TaxID=3365618 RepID=UPI0037B1AB2D